MQHLGIAFAKDNPALACPCCGGEWLHQGDIVSFTRDTEDAPARAVWVGEHGDVSGLRAAWAEANNPSRRRNGLTIRFWCETCDARPVLTMAQHKGATVITWVRD